MEREARGDVRFDEAVKDLLHGTIHPGLLDVYLEMKLITDLLMSHQERSCDEKLENDQISGLLAILGHVTDEIQSLHEQLSKVV